MAGHSGNEAVQVEQLGAAMTAERFLSWRLGFFGYKISEINKNSFKSGKNQKSKPHKRHLAGTVHEAVVPDLHEPAWQLLTLENDFLESALAKEGLLSAKR